MPRTPIILSFSRLNDTENFIISQAVSLGKYQNCIKKRVPEIVETFITVIIIKNKECQRVSYKNEHKNNRMFKYLFCNKHKHSHLRAHSEKCPGIEGKRKPRKHRKIIPTILHYKERSLRRWSGWGGWIRVRRALLIRRHIENCPGSG
jgi:hypothetical protein